MATPAWWMSGKLLCTCGMSLLRIDLIGRFVDFHGYNKQSLWLIDACMPPPTGLQEAWTYMRENPPRKPKFPENKSIREGDTSLGDGPLRGRKLSAWKRGRREEVERCETLREFETLGKARGYKDGWARIQYGKMKRNRRKNSK